MISLTFIIRGQVVDEQHRLYQQLQIEKVELKLELIDNIELPDYSRHKTVKHLNKVGYVTESWYMNQKGDTISRQYYIYDKDSIITGERVFYDSPDSGYFIEYRYDQQNKLITKQDYRLGSLFATTEYLYNRKGLVKKIQKEMESHQKKKHFDDSYVISFQYDELDRVTERKISTKRQGDKEWIKRTSRYTDEGSSRKVYKSESKSKEEWLDAEYIFDSQNRLSEIRFFTKAKNRVFEMPWYPDDPYRIEVSYSDDGLAMEEKLYLDEKEIGVRRYQYQYREQR